MLSPNWLNTLAEKKPNLLCPLPLPFSFLLFPPQVMARSSPSDKYLLVQALRSQGACKAPEKHTRR